MSLVAATSFSSIETLTPTAFIPSQSWEQPQLFQAHVLQEKVSLKRARAFLKGLPQEEASSIVRLFTPFIEADDTVETQHVFTRVRQAFNKQEGYLSRLFSRESWYEWAENRTPLGQVARAFEDCMKSLYRVRNFVIGLDADLIQKANRQAKALLQDLKTSATPLPEKSSNRCMSGLLAGTFGSIIAKNPIPFFLGASECLPSAYAQEMVGPEMIVNTITGGPQENPSIATLTSGQFAVAWDSNNQGIDHDVYAQMFFLNGTTVGGEIPVNSYIPASQRRASIAPLTGGELLCTWDGVHSTSQASSHIYGRILDVNRVFIGSQFQISTTNTPSPGQNIPTSAGLLGGKSVVCWESYNQDNQGVDTSCGVYCQLLSPTGTKLGGELRVNDQIADFQGNAHVSSCSDDRFFVSFSGNSDGSGYGVFGQWYNGTGNAAARIGNNLLVNTEISAQQDFPSSACLENGNVVVVYQSEVAPSFKKQIYAQVIAPNGAKIGSEQLVDPDLSEHKTKPSVAGLRFNRHVVVYTSAVGDGSGKAVFGQLFQSNMTRAGSRFLVNSFTTDDQENARVTALSSRDFVVTWQSTNQISGTDIVAQRFRDDVTEILTTGTTGTTGTTATTGTSGSTGSIMGGSSSTVFSSSSGTTSSRTTANLPTPVPNPIVSPSSEPPSLTWVWALLASLGGVFCLGTLTALLIRKRPWNRASKELSLTALDDHIYASSGVANLNPDANYGSVADANDDANNGTGRHLQQRYDKTPAQVTDATHAAIYAKTPANA